MKKLILCGITILMAGSAILASGVASNSHGNKSNPPNWYLNDGTFHLSQGDMMNSTLHIHYSHFEGNYVPNNPKVIDQSVFSGYTMPLQAAFDGDFNSPSNFILYFSKLPTYVNGFGFAIPHNISSDTVLFKNIVDGNQPDATFNYIPNQHYADSYTLSSFKMGMTVIWAKNGDIRLKVPVFSLSITSTTHKVYNYTYNVEFKN